MKHDGLEDTLVIFMFPENIDGRFQSIIYVGSSMYPLLKDLDTLYFVPYGGQTLKSGDVILFKNKKSDKAITITHRIVSINDVTIITKGDNNLCIDNFLVDTSDIIGLVVQVKRGNKIFRVRNGGVGMLLAKVIHLFLLIKIKILHFISFPYSWVSKSGILQRFVPRKMKQSFIGIQRPGGIEYHFLIGKYLVAKHGPGSSTWTILPPFRLFIDENSLPAVNSTIDRMITDNEIST